MRVTTLGIGIDKLSITKNGVNLYGNANFAAWANASTMRLKKVTPGPDGLLFTFAQGGGLNTKPANGGHWWHRTWSVAQRRTPLIPFGATEPLRVRMSEEQELEILMPPAARCAKVLRPNGNHKKRAKEAAIEAARYIPPELPLEDPVTEVTNEPDYGPEPGPTDPAQHMRDAVSTINAFKGMWGDSILLTLTTDGRLRVYEAHD